MNIRKNTLIILLSLTFSLKTVISGVLTLNPAESSRTQITPIARVINSQAEANSWFLNREAEPTITLSITPPSLVMSDETRIRTGFFTVNGSIDISYRTSLGISFYTGKWYNDNLMLINPKLILSTDKDRKRYVVTNFLQIRGTDDFSYKSQSITLLQVINVNTFHAFSGLSIGEIDCKTRVSSPASFKQTLIMLHIGVLVRKGNFAGYSLESSISKHFIDLKLTTCFNF